MLIPRLTSRKGAGKTINGTLRLIVTGRSGISDPTIITVLHILRYQLDRNIEATQTHIFYRAAGLMEKLFPSYGWLKREACFDAIRRIASALNIDLYTLGVVNNR
jgi:hypothetical protein